MSLGVLLCAGVLAGCYSIEPLPPGKITHTFNAQHPTEGACEVRPPVVVRPCCAVQELPNGKVKELPNRLGRNGYLFDTFQTNSTVTGSWPIFHEHFYVNGYTKEIYVPACLNQRDVTHYINQNPEFRKYRRTKNFDTGQVIFYGIVESGPGHRY